MIWLAWRRHRLALIVASGTLFVLALWMALVAHSFQVSTHDAGLTGCLENITRCNLTFHGWSSPQQQAALIDLLLFVVPCLFGVVLGVPLVARELQDHTNRLAWTQGISRTRWLVVKWSVVGLSAVALIALLQLVVQWWSGHVLVNFLETNAIPGSARIQPRLFNVTGIVPIAYVLFAFALGTALGAIFRRVGWAVAGTVIGYGSAAELMVLGIRPSLASQSFVPESTIGGYAPSPPHVWDLGFGFRFIPGSGNLARPATPGQIARSCSDQSYHYYPPSRYFDCLTAHHVEGGFLYQPASHYWSLQWGEAAIYLASAFVLLGVTLWAVRRWRA